MLDQPFNRRLDYGVFGQAIAPSPPELDGDVARNLGALGFQVAGRQPAHLVVEPHRFNNHERIYLIVDRVSGHPLFDPAVYALAQLRPRNVAATTIRNASYAILALHLACDAEGIDLSARIAAALPITLPNLQLIRRRMRMTLAELRHDARQLSANSSNRSDALKARNKELWVCQEVFKARMYEAFAYVRWLYEMELGRRHPLSPEYAVLERSIQQLARIHKLFKSVAGRTRVGEREGLEDQIIEVLLAAIELGSPSNPWSSPFVQSRNRLIILLALKLGLRIGEILGLKGSDLNIAGRALLIRRRADDPDDTRLEQSNAKTNDRVLRYGEDVAEALENFIIEHRGELPGAREHEFLIVAAKTGVPLSRSAAKKIFHVLRSKVHGLPEDLVAHVLRHCFNDDFTKKADTKKLSEAKEKKLRNYHNGWSEHSDSADFYTRRHVRREAGKFSLEVQARTLAATAGAK